MGPDEAYTQALRILRALCGDAWTSPPVRVRDSYPLAASGRVILTGRPIDTVNSVRLYRLFSDFTRTLTTPSEWFRSSGIMLRIDPRIAASYTGGTGRAGLVDGGVVNAGCTDVLVEVDYTFGTAEPPSMVIDAAQTLANEIVKACACDASCRLPSRVTTVTRQGTSWTLLDPEDLLEDGRTGVYEIDLAIHALNPSRAKTRAGVRTVEHPPAERIFVA